jgi:NOL1/NOP2/fmu family ribosome biogenesis protein
MQQIRAMNSKEKKELNKMLIDQFGAGIEGYNVFINPKNKIFLIGEEYSKINIEKLRINSLGLYFGEIYEGKVRLSIEGAQIIGKTAASNILVVDDTQANIWMKGEDFDIDSDLEGFVIIKNREDVLGCGKIAGKKLDNYMPKERRLNVQE